MGLLGAGGDYRAVEWAPDGLRVYGLTGSGVDELDPTTGTTTPIYNGRTSPALAAHPTGDLVAIATLTDGVRLIGIGDGNEQRVLRTPTSVTAMAFSPSGRHLATGERSGTLSIWELSSLQLIDSIAAHPETRNEDLPPEVRYPEAARHESTLLSVGVEDLLYTPDGSTIVTTGGIFLRSFDAATLKPEIDLPLDREQITGGRIPARPTDVALSADSSTAYVAAGQEAKVVDLDEGRVVTSFRPTNRPGSVPDRFALATTGDHIITAINVGELNFHDLNTGQVVGAVDAELSTESFIGADLAVSPDETAVAISGVGGVKVFSLNGSGLISRSIKRPGWGASIYVSGDGETLLWGALNRPPVFFDMGDENPEPIDVDIDDAFSGSLGEFGGPTVLARADNGQSIGWYVDPDTFQSTGRRAFGPATVLVGAVSPDGELVAHGLTSPDPAVVNVVDRETGRAVAPVLDATNEEEAIGINALTWSPDQSMLAASTHRRGITVYDTATWSPIGPSIGQQEPILDVEFSPDGQHMLTADISGLVIVRNAETFQPSGIELRLGTTGINASDGDGLEFSDDGRYLLSTIDEPRLVDTGTWTVIGAPFPSERGFRTIAPAGARYVATVRDDRIVVWTLDPDSWPEIACRAAGRNLTESEWLQFGPVGEPRTRTCPQWE